LQISRERRFSDDELWEEQIFRISSFIKVSEISVFGKAVADIKISFEVVFLKKKILEILQVNQRGENIFLNPILKNLNKR